MWQKIKHFLYHKKIKSEKIIYKFCGIPIKFSGLINFFQLLMIKLNQKQAIVLIEGGICSQIHQYLIGETLTNKGIHVEYDISWFEECGKDINGKFVRNFDLLKAFPNLKFQKASKQKVLLFKKRYQYSEQEGESFLNAQLPTYFGGYKPSYRKNLLPFNHKISHKDFNDNDQKIYQQIIKDRFPVGIHVRRGDMAISKANWKTCPPKYFVNAIKFMIQQNKDASFYFFSDEPEWVKKEIIPLLKIKNKIYVLENNGSDRGYIDLALLASCPNIIASQGSFGYYANMLNNFKKKILVYPKELGKTEIQILRNSNELIQIRENIML